MIATVFRHEERVSGVFTELQYRGDHFALLLPDATIPLIGSADDAVRIYRELQPHTFKHYGADLKQVRSPLFIPLRSKYFWQFATGEKRIEWRQYGQRWNKQAIPRGRFVALSLGYRSTRLYGVVESVRRVSTTKQPSTIYPKAKFLCAIHIRVLTD